MRNLSGVNDIQTERECLSDHLLNPAEKLMNASSGVHLDFLTCFPFQGQILVNGVAVLEAAVEAKNGRLYVMDGVLTPPSIEPVLPHRCDITDTKLVQVSLMVCSV